MTFNKNILNMVLWLCMGAVCFSCKDDANNWSADSSQDGLFRPLKFELPKVNATSVEILFTKVVNAEKYIFEFSENSGDFTDPIRTEMVDADTLQAYTASSTATRVEYRKLFPELNSATQHSVRMKAINETAGLESQYVELTFATLTENIFTGVKVSIDGAILTWTPTDRITRIIVKQNTTDEIVYESEITNAEIDAAKVTITGLNPGTYYTAIIYNGEYKRGETVFKTDGSEGSFIYQVADVGDILSDLSDLAAEGKDNITMIFTPGQAYSLGTLKVPAGINELILTSSDSESASINLNQLAVSAATASVSFQNLTLTGDGSKRLIDTGIAITNITLSNCTIENYNGVILVQNVAITIGNIEINDCLIRNIGNRSILNISANVKLGEVVVSNSTITQVVSQFADIRSAAESIVIRNCTFYNSTVAYSQFYRFDANNLPIALTHEKLIIAGSNNGSKMNSTYGNYGTIATFGDSYRTNDLQINTREFEGITVFDGPAADLFIDPENGDFSIKPGNGFGGTGIAGDPRWF